MRLKKGSKVEVLNRRELPSGSWSPAEIVSGNGRTYIVKYDCFMPETESSIKRVSRKDVRPCPLSVLSSRSWVPGDIVEVLENNCWKSAKVSKVVDGGTYVFVRVLGSSREFKSHKMNLRSRQSWKEDEWAANEKESGEGYDGNNNMLLKVGKLKSEKFHPFLKLESFKGSDHVLKKNGRFFEDHHQVHLRNMKRKKQLNSQNEETCLVAVTKMETPMREKKSQRLNTRDSSQPPEKVDAYASPQIMFSEKYMLNSLKSSTAQFPVSNVNWAKCNDDFHIKFSVGRSESSDSESCSSSVGSSSPSYSPYRSKLHIKAAFTQKDGMDSEVHQLELNAYRSTLVALYASGPLSWEQEAMLTNLRLMLHITNDEHLLELKYLATSKCNLA